MLRVFIAAAALASLAHAPLFPHPCVTHDGAPRVANASLPAGCGQRKMHDQRPHDPGPGL